MRHPARYTVTSGLAGLYTPNDNSGPGDYEIAFHGLTEEEFKQEEEEAID